MSTASTRCSTGRRASSPWSRRRCGAGDAGHRRDRPRQRVRRPSSSTSAATDAGIKPIIGIEAYVTPGTHRVRQGARALGHARADRRRRVGLRRLHAHDPALRDDGGHAQPLPALEPGVSMEGYYFKPRMDRELLAELLERPHRHDRLPVGGEVQTRLRLGQYDAAQAAAAEFRTSSARRTTSPRSWTTGCAIERRVMGDLLRISKDLDIPLVATNDLHYTHQHDATSHAALLCVQSGSTLDDPNRFKFDGDGYYVKIAGGDAPALPRPPRGLRQHAAHRRALRGRVRHERQLHAALPGARRARPRSPGSSRRSRRASHYRYPDGIPDEVREQADYEIGVIVQMGFPGYFLVVADFINWAKENGIRVGPGRGSGAGSMAAYAMRITDLDPLQHGLIFERFLNPDRVSMPDFDVDFDDRRRGEVIQYVTEKYGDERVAQIVTYGTIKAKQALKDAGRVLGFPFSMGEKLTKAMPPAVMGKDMPLDGHVRQGPPALQRGVGVPRPHRDRSRGEDGLRHGRRPREPQAPVGRARRRRHHVQRAADRHHPDHEARAGRPDRHAVRLPGVRVARSDQDGLPGAAQPHDHRRRPRQHRRQPRAHARARRAARSTTGAPTTCSPAATRSACSSSTAGRCAACCG